MVCCGEARPIHRLKIIELTYMNYKIDSLPKNQIFLSNYNSLLRESFGFYFEDVGFQWTTR